MDKELNNYHIKNPDGADKTVRNNGKQSYLNDNPHFIREDYLKGQSEWDNSVSEGYFGSEKEQVKNADISTKNDGISSSSVSSSAVSSGASSAAVSSAIGGSVGALAGTVAASVMAAVVVVAVFVSTLTINLSLLMASMTSLTFQVEMSGAQEEDFVKPIIAVLTDNDGVYLEQEIKQDSLFLTFDDLEAGKEYLITVKNEEKVFYSKSYFTATEEVEKGFVETFIEGDEVFAVVSQVNLSSGEYYTLTVKDDKGNTVFVKDDAKQFAEYGFKIPDAKKLLISFAVNGKVYSVSELEIEKDVDPPFTPEYDFSNPVWTWDSDFGAATASFTEIHGGEPLMLNATVMSNTTEATCDKDGFTSYTATVNYEGITYYDYKEEIIPALGHEYGEPEFTWVQNATGGYTATATFVCIHNSGHTFDLSAIVSQSENGYYAEVEYEGTVYRDEYVINAILSLNNGIITLYADGYEQGGVFTAFDNTENRRYVISGSRTDDMPLRLYTTTHNMENVSGTVNFYVDFDNATIKASSWASAIHINVYTDVNIYINNKGTTTINPYNHPAFAFDGSSGYNVNIEVTSENGFDSFICTRQYSGTPTLYNYNGATFKMNGEAYDNNQNRI